jgi:hypothetical protein
MFAVIVAQQWKARVLIAGTYCCVTMERGHCWNTLLRNSGMIALVQEWPKAQR